MKASSESGECASLISTGSFSVVEAVCWPGMSVSVSFSGATPARPGHFPCKCEAVASPWRWFFPERLSRTGEGLSETNGRKRARCRGLHGAWPGDSCKRSLAYWGAANNWKARASGGLRITIAQEHIRPEITELMRNTGRYRGKWDRERYSEETMRAMASSKEARPSR